MACPTSNAVESKGAILGVSVTDATTAQATLTVQTNAPKGATSIDLQSDEVGGTTLKKGDILFFGAGKVAIVAADTPVSDTVTTAVPVYGVLADLTATTDTSPYFAYEMIGGITGISVDDTRDSIDAGDLGDYAYKKFVAGMNTFTISGDMNIITGNTAYKTVVDYHKQPVNLHWMVGYPNGMYEQFCGFSTGIPKSVSLGSLITGSIAIQGNGEISRFNLV